MSICQEINQLLNKRRIIRLTSMREFVVRVFTNFTVTNSTELLGRTSEEMRLAGVRVVMNESGDADLAVVLNAVVQPKWVRVPAGQLVKVLQEPVISNPVTHLFTYRHSSIYDQIFTHTPSGAKSREVLSLPLTGTFVDPEEVADLTIEQKSKTVSIIASTLSVLPGHKRRSEFITQLLSARPDLIEHTFGKGRPSELVRKVDGLREYRYSVAIENTRSPRYITEKFCDCILAGTVPLYYGAPDIGEYFPPESFIALPMDDMQQCLNILNRLSEDDYRNRIPALLEARRLIRDRYSVGALILARIDAVSGTSTQEKMLKILFRLDGVLMQCQRFGVTLLPRRIISCLLTVSRRILSSRLAN